MALRTYDIEAGGRQIHMAADGIAAGKNGQLTDEPVFMFVHGIGVSERYFRPLMRRLAKQYAVYALDLPGFGVSPDPKRPLTMAELADVLLAVIDKHDLKQLILVGHSMGCQVVVEAVRRRPSVAHRVILIGPTIDSGHRRVLSQAKRLLVNIRHESLRTLAVVAVDYIRCGPRRYVQTLRPMMRYEIERHITACPVPVLVVRGEHDTIVPPVWAQRLANEAQHGSLVEIRRAGHIVQHRRPAEVARYCQAFAVQTHVSSEEVDRQLIGSSDAMDWRPLKPAELSAAVTNRLSQHFPLSHGLFQTWLDWLYVWRRQFGRFLQLDKADQYQRTTSSKPPVIVIPGIYEPWQFMKPLIETVHAWKYSVHVIDTLGYNTGDIPEMADLVRRLMEERGLRDVIIIAHSKGGLIGKYLLATQSEQQPLIRHVVALNTPFAGSVYAALAPVRPVRSFSPTDTLLQELSANQAVNPRITSIYSKFDPSIPDGSALPGATNVAIDTIGHFRIVANAAAHRAVLEALKGSGHNTV